VSSEDHQLDEGSQSRCRCLPGDELAGPIRVVAVYLPPLVLSWLVGRRLGRVVGRRVGDIGRQGRRVTYEFVGDACVSDNEGRREIGVRRDNPAARVGEQLDDLSRMSARAASVDGRIIDLHDRRGT
jgi:hypothetical protein